MGKSAKRSGRLPCGKYLRSGAGEARGGDFGVARADLAGLERFVSAGVGAAQAANQEPEPGVRRDRPGIPEVAAGNVDIVEQTSLQRGREVAPGIVQSDEVSAS